MGQICTLYTVKYILEAHSVEYLGLLFIYLSIYKCFLNISTANVYRIEEGT